MHASDPTSPPAGRPDSARPGSPSSETAGEPPSDVTLSFAHRRLLRELLRGRPPGDDATRACCDVLVGAGLVALEGGHRYVVTAEGEAYLAAHEEAVTRRLPRPKPPTRPALWEVDGCGGWYYRGRVAHHALDLAPEDDEDEEEVWARHEERAEATLQLIRYLRGLRAYQSRAARDGAAPAPQSTARRESVDSGTAGSGEPPFADVAP